MVENVGGRGRSVNEIFFPIFFQLRIFSLTRVPPELDGVRIKDNNEMRGFPAPKHFRQTDGKVAISKFLADMFYRNTFVFYPFSSSFLSQPRLIIIRIMRRVQDQILGIFKKIFNNCSFIRSGRAKF